MLNKGQILDGKYEIIKVLGRGGMGTVYLCKNNRLGNFWAVKEVNGQWKDKIDFLAEPNILKNLSHIGIVRIIDIFYENDNLYIVEDYIEGMTLKEHVEADGVLSPELIRNISLQLCSILGYLHSFNPPIIYRDLKPANIMIKPNNKVVLIDFGIARTYKENQEGDTMILGSMGYIAPEQIINAQSNAQTDIYSLGATMFFMLTGKSISMPSDLVFEGNTAENREIANRLVKVIQKASALESQNRYIDVKMMVQDLNVITDDEEYNKTMLMDSYEASPEAPKEVLAEDNKLKKRTKLIIIAVLACIIALVVFLANQAAKKNASDVTPVKAVEETKPKVEATKEVVENDIVVRGILDMKDPVILSSGSSNGKARGKDKDKDKHKSDEENQLAQYNLNPAATISNSKLSISLTKIQVMDKDVTAILSILNTSDDALKLDLSKTYLVNGKNESEKGYVQNLATMLTIPKKLEKQEFKVYFKDVDFKESSYTLRTVFSSTINKDINLSVDVIK